MLNHGEMLKCLIAKAYHHILMKFKSTFVASIYVHIILINLHIFMIRFSLRKTDVRTFLISTFYYLEPSHL
jgi:hypothetical protein